jgi:hypothetical protein
MPEKVIHEVRFIETDDGYRIEVKGDKERLKKMGFYPGMGFGPGMHFRRWARKARKHRHGHGFMPPWMWGDESEDEPDEAPAEEA